MSPGYGHSVVQLLILDPVAIFNAKAAGALILTAVEVSIMNHKWSMHFDPLTWCTPRLVLDNWYVPLAGAMCVDPGTQEGVVAEWFYSGNIIK